MDWKPNEAGLAQPCRYKDSTFATRQLNRLAAKDGLTDEVALTVAALFPPFPPAEVFWF